MDDARSHISTLKMLRNFHYIDEKGKDEGINGNAFLICFVLPVHNVSFQSVTALVNLWSCLPTSRKFVRNAERRRPIDPNTLALEMME